MSGDEDHIPVAAPIDSESAGRGGNVASLAVMRVICPQTNSAGTGFLRRSGSIITAEHVVHGCQQATLVLRNLTQITAKVIASDVDHDLALLQPQSAIAATPLPISGHQSFSIGAHVSTWGFPGGYTGASPMLSVGYLAAMDAHTTASGKTIRQWVVNAAFNSGNSGGPLLLIETGEVFGVVSSKLAPISPAAVSALTALQNQKSGFTYTRTNPDGSTVDFSEGQVVAMVLDELRRQVQLVIGYAALLEDLETFIKAHGIDP